MTEVPTTRFAPDRTDARAFRDALGRFGTGVTIVTCCTPSGAPLGITANSFAAVSLDPPLILWSPAKASARHDAFVTARHFCVHVLAAEQAHLGRAFAREGDAFPESGWRPLDHDVPGFDHTLSRFFCRTEAVHDGGDHTIVVGHVLEVETRAGSPLMFFGGRFGSFAET